LYTSLSSLLRTPILTKREISTVISARTRLLHSISLSTSLITKLAATILLRQLPLLLRTTLKILVIISVVAAVAKAAADAIVADKEVIAVAALIELTLILQLYLLEYN
jgi:hypothetical protein